MLKLFLLIENIKFEKCFIVFYFVTNYSMGDSCHILGGFVIQ